MLKKFSVLLFICIFVSIFLLMTAFPAVAEVTIKEYAKNQLLKETNFDKGSGLPWHVCETNPAKAEFEIAGGKYRVTVKEVAKENPNRWDIQFRHRDLFVESGHKYTVKFTVKASKACKIYPKIGDQGDPYTEDWNYNQKWEQISLTANKETTITQTFTANRSAKVLEWAFHLADAPVGTIFEFDNLSLTDPQFKGYSAETRPDYREIRLNQLGYFPNREKLATLNTDSTSPVKWTLQDSSGKTVSSGTTKVIGEDKDSGENVHIIDFTSFNKPGKDYKLIADSEPVLTGSDSEADSYPFDIGTDMYNDLVFDSLKYFYHSRSGIEIKMPYCESEELARPAGHKSDKAATSTVEKGDWAYNEDYTIDMTGGWYDAGDHGKYVVNGGITVWTLQNLYERGLYTEDGVKKFADNTMNIPESGNKYPDLLDETRYHMEVMLKLQVPDGKGRAGMAFHKGHDITWTGLAVRPDQDDRERILKPPTTAATLNLAATAAQANRLWKEYDSTFANKCLAAAEKAWKAALKNPAIYAPFDEAIGGGPYGDNYVEDDFYWAACELYATTGKTEYQDYIKKSKHYLEVPTHLTAGEETDTVGNFNWGNTGALGSLTLALVPNKLGETEIAKVRSNIAKAADYTAEVEAKQGYGIPIEQCSVLEEGFKGYPWGSNSFVTNICIVTAYAYDYTKDAKYLNATTQAMDYIMGRNPNERSYITGYGDYPVKYPHHRFFAGQINEDFPLAPAGICVGGPNSGLQDPWVKGSGWKPGDMAPQKCYMDHIESWSTNECTINWNAPIAWVASFLSTNGNKTTTTAKPAVKPTTKPLETPIVETKPVENTESSTPNSVDPLTSSDDFPIEYTINGSNVTVTINNNTATDKEGWELSFTFPGNQKIKSISNAAHKQKGADVTIINSDFNNVIPADGSISFGFKISYTGTNDKPTNFKLE